MMNMKLLAVVISLSIYLSFSTRRTFWEGKLAEKENLFLAVNMKICGCLNVRKHKKIKVSNKYFTLEISLNFEKLDKMKIIFSESKGKLERSGK